MLVFSVPYFYVDGVWNNVCGDDGRVAGGICLLFFFYLLNARRPVSILHANAIVGKVCYALAHLLWASVRVGGAGCSPLSGVHVDGRVVKEERSAGGC